MTAKAAMPPVQPNEVKHPIGAGKMFAWQSRAISIGANLMIFGFLSLYCTDYMGISAGLVGLLLMVSKIFDGFTDLIAGYIVDRTNTKLGRGRPYELCIIGVWLCTWLMFSCPPALSVTLKCVWIFLMYVLVTSIFTTFLNASQTVYMVRAFKHRDQYVAISSYGSIITMLAVVAVNVTLPILTERLATSPQGWSSMALIYAAPLAIIGIMRFIFIKETNDVDAKSDEKVRIKDVILVLKTNKYIYIIALVTLVYNFVLNMGILQYYFRYIVGNIELMGAMAAIQMIAIPLVFIFPKFIKRYSVTALIASGVALVILGYIVNFIAYDNFPLLVVGQIIIGAGNVPMSMMIGLLIIDCAEYNEWKRQPRLEGTMTNINGFAQKVGSAFGAGAMGLLLSTTGYIGAAETQIGSAMTMIRMLNSLIPAGLFVLVLIALRLYKLETQMPVIREENVRNRSAVITGEQ
ncbi:MAG: MFS transporter [Oscillospiraceae bacterium]|jgi:probable glucitol transport protein GutA|nr:MFS transporter [Oscillospiraceae bacterium]